MTRSPAQLLLAAGYELDAAVQAFGPAVLRVPVRAAPTWMRRLWFPGISGMTMPWAIYVHPHVYRRGSAAVIGLLLHELVHVDQMRRDGAVRFLGRYLWEYAAGLLAGMGHTAAYRRISFEVEARHASERLRLRFE